MQYSGQGLSVERILSCSGARGEWNQKPSLLAVAKPGGSRKEQEKQLDIGTGLDKSAEPMQVEAAPRVFFHQSINLFKPPQPGQSMAQ